MTDINQLLTTLADEVIEAAQRNIGATRSVRGFDGKVRRRRIDSTGTLRNNLGYSIVENADTANIVFSAGGRAKNYFLAVNDGRRPGKMPPTTAILDWMKAKPVRLRGAGGGFIKSTEKGRIRAAFAIAKAIERRGIAPTYYYTDAIQTVLERKGQEFTDNLAKQLETGLKQWQ
jgi:hypothetical protein